MSEVRDVQQYALRHLVSPEFAKDRAALEAFMKADIAASLSREGDYEIVPDSYHLEIIPRISIEGRPLFTELEEEAGAPADALVARMTVRCYLRVSG